MARPEVEADSADQRSVADDLHVGRTDPDNVDVFAPDREVGRDNRSPSWWERRDQLALGAEHTAERFDQLEVHRPDVRDDADLRPRDLGQLGDLTEPTHRKLENANFGVRLEPAECERHTDLVVVARLGRNRDGRGGAERRKDVLRRRLTHRARDRNDARRTAFTYRPADPGERLEGIVRNQHSGREHNQAVAFSRRSASRTTSRSSKGSFRPAISWPCSWPLPAITTTSPSRADSSTRSIARRRSSSISRSRPSTISDAITAGSSLRGLSDVTSATSASSVTTCPINGRFTRSRSPPAPKTQMTRPRPSSRAASRTVSSAPGVCA